MPAIPSAAAKVLIATNRGTKNLFVSSVLFFPIYSEYTLIMGQNRRLENMFEGKKGRRVSGTRRRGQVGQ
jgi:hypothetical protein